ncbi:hypothetical protein C2G38_2161840 [Gigaspora rosea]|uniref:Uncharacterized protein n=1 Tax=Gigaspora rosea TaxID=44941 RepID=A0A397W114_9GLOM|nr:hypothetical protein C2G38_2161840 [Gigaspora rosea]
MSLKLPFFYPNSNKFLLIINTNIKHFLEQNNYLTYLASLPTLQKVCELQQLCNRLQYTRTIIVDPNNVTIMQDNSHTCTIPADHARNITTFVDPMATIKDDLSYYYILAYFIIGELEGGFKRATDMNWSPQIYHIRESLVQKNQPILYWLEDDKGNGPKRSFVREELQIIHPNTELPPQWVLTS